MATNKLCVNFNLRGIVQELKQTYLRLLEEVFLISFHLALLLLQPHPTSKQKNIYIEFPLPLIR